MKAFRTAVLILSGLLVATVVLAGDINLRVAALKAPLSLSDQQIQELNDIVTETQDKIQALRAEIRALNKQKQARIDAVLTAEQRKKYEDIMNPSFPLESEPSQMMPMGIEPEASGADKKP